jgi:hypothetical protein
MPLYFFHLRDGSDSLIDAEGLELDGPDAARQMALVQARDIISHEAMKGAINLRQRIEVVDTGGRCVATVSFSDAVNIQS